MMLLRSSVSILRSVAYEVTKNFRINVTGNSSVLLQSVQPFSCGTLVCYAKKKRVAIPFSYVREPKTPGYLVSDDNEGFPEIDLDQPTLEFQNCEGLKDANDIVKKLTSLRFGRNEDVFMYGQQEIVKKVQQHQFDRQSIESKVANMTAFIRFWQPYMKIRYKDGARADQVNQAIARRKRLLKVLRARDFKRFEWLLDVLNISYYPPPMFYHWKTRKGTLRTMTKQHCTKLRKTKIDEYRAVLKAQQADFLDDKEKTLKWIAEEEQQLQLTEAERTDMEVRQRPFQIPNFPKHLSSKKAIMDEVKPYPEKLMD